jgi:hypothetical protein
MKEWVFIQSFHHSIIQSFLRYEQSKGWLGTNDL